MSDGQKPEDKTSRRLSAAFDQLGEGVIVTDSAGRIVFMNAAAVRIHGKKALGTGPGEYAGTFGLLTMDGEPYSGERLPLTRAVLHAESSEDCYWKIARPDGEILVALGKARPVFDADGQQVGAVLTMHDETAREAERQALNAAIEMKDLLLHEVHHRVKNNLQLVSSLLSLQGRKTEDPHARNALRDLSARIDVIADIHRALYEAGETDSIEVVAYIGRLCRRYVAPLAESCGARLQVDIDGACLLPIEKATSLSLVLNELVLNSLQHAFAHTSEPRIAVSVSIGEGALRLSYSDNGAGPADPFSQTGAQGLGRLLVRGLEKQLGATIGETGTGEGFGLEIDIPLEGNRVVAE